LNPSKKERNGNAAEAVIAVAEVALAPEIEGKSLRDINLQVRRKGSIKVSIVRKNTLAAVTMSQTVTVQGGNRK